MIDGCILVVEDERILAEYIKLELREMGYDSCESVSSGKEAVKRADLGSGGLILNDIKPEGPMDGVEAAEKVKAFPPVVVEIAFSGVSSTRTSSWRDRFRGE